MAVEQLCCSPANFHHKLITYTPYKDLVFEERNISRLCCIIILLLVWLGAGKLLTFLILS